MSFWQWEKLLGYSVLRETLIKRSVDSLCIKVLPHGLTVVELVDTATGTRARLSTELQFGDQGKHRSVSFDQRPDVTLEIQRPDGRTELILLDPKYKLDSEVELLKARLS